MSHRFSLSGDFTLGNHMLGSLGSFFRKKYYVPYPFRRGQRPPPDQPPRSPWFLYESSRACVHHGLAEDPDDRSVTLSGWVLTVALTKQLRVTSDLEPMKASAGLTSSDVDSSDLLIGNARLQEMMVSSGYEAYAFLAPASMETLDLAPVLLVLDPGSCVKIIDRQWIQADESFEDQMEDWEESQGKE
jgi:hypothetical protein